MEGNKIIAECKFDGLKNDELIYRCRKYKMEWERSIKLLIRKFQCISVLQRQLK